MEDIEQGHPHGTDKVAHIQGKLTEVKGIMKHNIEEVMKRGVDLDKLEGQAKKLDDQASDYMQVTRDVRWKMWLQNMKIKLSVICIFIVIGFVIWLSICKGFKC